MDLIISIILAFSALVFGIFKGIFIGYILILCLLIFSCTAWRRGFTWKKISNMVFRSGRKAVIVLRIFILIGMITASWMVSGTVPGIVYYGIKLMNPNYFILYAFLISAGVSFLLGTSFGTISTVGVALMVMAKSGGISINMVAGALMAGAYFGDRCSPMSSSANLIANLTDTNLYVNIRNMFKSGAIPFILSTLFYWVISIKKPLDFLGNSMTEEIGNSFIVNWMVLWPAIIILILSAFRVDVKISMLFSILTASVAAIGIQGYSWVDILRYLFFGFTLPMEDSLQGVLRGGGILSMWKPALVVFVSCGLAGVLEDSGMLGSAEKLFSRGSSRWKLFGYTTLTSIGTGALGCSQTMAVVLTHQLMRKSYQQRKMEKYQLALDIENTGIVISALIPWNIAAMVPTTTLGVSSTGFIPYSIYLYLVPLWTLLCYKIEEIKGKKGYLTAEEGVVNNG
ncbi:MAG: Na+/H+ antiporter NhaC family protein [Thermotaleaceae bacterium]